jgi:chitinase
MLSIADASAPEGNKGKSMLSLTVTLSRSISESVTVKYATADGTALAKSDYTATSGTLTFSPGQTTRTIAVALKVDRKREPNETFTVRLSSAVGATIDDAVATATIANDD